MREHASRLALTLLVMPLCAGSAGAQTDAPWWAALPREVYRTLDRVEVDTDWFEVYRVAPGVTAIYEPGHWQETVSYLIEGDDRAVLFDTALGIGDIRHVVDQVTTLDVTVVNSHTHADHIGGNPGFDGFAVFDSEPGRRRLSAGRDMTAQITDETVWMELPLGFDAAAYAMPPMTPTEVLRDGDVIELGGRSLEVLHTPGHTTDSISLLDRAGRILFTGDTYYPADLYAHRGDADLETYVETARRLGALEAAVDLVCPGHNEAKVDGAVLGRLARAFEMIWRGEAAGEPAGDGVVRYEVEGIGVLTREAR